MSSFLFSLGEKVQIAATGESGEIIGRAEFLHHESSYQLRYKCGDGRAIESWWGESALAPV